MEIQNSTSFGARGLPLDRDLLATVKAFQQVQRDALVEGVAVAQTRLSRGWGLLKVGSAKVPQKSKSGLSSWSRSNPHGYLLHSVQKVRELEGWCVSSPDGVPCRSLQNPDEYFIRANALSAPAGETSSTVWTVSGSGSFSLTAALPVLISRSP